ncbi:MAG: hypothetical protein ACP5F6_00675 [Microbacter sp.]
MRATSTQSTSIAMLDTIPVLAVDIPSRQHELNRAILPCICFWYPTCRAKAYIDHSKLVK